MNDVVTVLVTDKSKEEKGSFPLEECRGSVAKESGH